MTQFYSKSGDSRSDWHKRQVTCQRGRLCADYTISMMNERKDQRSLPSPRSLDANPRYLSAYGPDTHLSENDDAVEAIV